MVEGSAEGVVREKVPGLREHAWRHSLTNEVHARPYELLRAPVRASHLAVATGENKLNADRAHLLELCALYAVAPPAADAIHFSRDFSTGAGPGFRLRWERHTEFSTYTFLRFDDFDEPFNETALSLAPRDWLDGLPGEVLVAQHLALESREREAEDLVRLFDENQVIGSRVQSGAACAWTDFRIHGDGFGRVLIRDLGMTLGQAGRLLQRLTEIETYRIMALLAFPLAREVGPKISRLEQSLAAIIGQMAEPGDGEGAAGGDRELLDRLTALAAEAEQISALSSYRFSAARAYHAIVRSRIEELREDRISGTQTILEFMDRRLAPAMKTCDAMAERQDVLSRRVARAGDLLRTRVDIALEEKNRDLLKSMDRRAHVQLRLQETVEGLSVVAISYYLLGLVGYVAKGAKAAGLPVNPDVAVMVGLPVVLGLVWIGVRRLRAALVGGEEGHE